MRILLIRLRLIGDVVFTTPVIRALRRRFPGAHISYVVEPHALPVVAENPHLDEIVLAPAPGAPRRLLADVALARMVRRGRYDVAIDLHGGPRAALLAWLSRAPRRIGYEISGRSWMYTDRVERSRTLQPRHSVENQWDLLRPLGFGDPDPEQDATEMRAPAGASRSVVERLSSRGADPSRHPILVVHVSAGNPFRRWPAASFVDLVKRLARADEQRRIVIVSGPSERAAAREIGARAKSELAPATVIDDVELDLGELRALLDHAVLFVGGDSGPLHVAGTSGVPVVGLFGPTLSERSAPWRSRRFVTESVELRDLACRPCHQRACEPGDYRCLGWIGSERVADAAERAMRRASALEHDAAAGLGY